MTSRRALLPLILARRFLRSRSLARTTLVKDEAHYDKFDRAFGEYFHGVQTHLFRAGARAVALLGRGVLEPDEKVGALLGAGGRRGPEPSHSRAASFGPSASAAPRRWSLH